MRDASPSVGLDLQRAFTTLVTPFCKGGDHVDWAAYERLIERQVREGAGGLVCAGPTGEANTLTHDEHVELIHRTVELAAGRLPVLAGTGSNSTREAQALTHEAEKAGAAGVVMITPYGNVPTQQGLVLHFMKVAEHTSLPIIVHNTPARTGVRLELETLKAISAHPNFVAVEDSSASMDYAAQILKETRLALVSGNDNLTLPLLAVGAVGVVTVVGNLRPRWAQQLIEHVKQREWDEARDLHDELFPVVEALMAETNPIPVKAALEMMGLIEGDIRSPLTPLTDRPRLRLRHALAESGML